MFKRLLIIINENLDSYSAFIADICDTNQYRSLILTVDELLTDKFKSQITEHRVFDVCIAIETSHFKKHEQEIRTFFQSIYNAPFINILQFYTDITQYKALIANNKTENSFFLHLDCEPMKVFICFSAYLNDFFIKSTMSYRLSDYIFQSFKGVVDSELLKMRNMEVQKLNAELERRNRTDPLTDLYNRTALYEFLEKERKHAILELSKLNQSDLENELENDQYSERRKRNPVEDKDGNLIIFAVMMIDLDNFKKVNDTYGHLTGDIVLKTLGKIFKREGVLREQDIEGRFGGEEFIVILPGTNSLNAIGPAKRLMQELNSHAFTAPGFPEFKVTMSIGISEYQHSDKSGDDIIQRADKALYLAKEQGRNRIILY